jgi:hemoglobin
MSRMLPVVLTFVGLAAAVVTAQGRTAPPAESLYKRLGGAYAIAAVVDDFIDRLLVNDTLNSNPAIDKARSTVPKQGLKFHVTTLVCAATGGPCNYTGRPMKESHAHLNISEREWAAMIADFKATLTKFKVPDREQGELVGIVESTKIEIVVGGKSS